MRLCPALDRGCRVAGERVLGGAAPDGSSPSTLDARVPAIQRPSARSHRTVDNLLITSRIEYSRSSYIEVMDAVDSIGLKADQYGILMKLKKSNVNGHGGGR